MGLRIDNAEAEKIAIHLSNMTGHAVEEEVLFALQERARKLDATAIKSSQQLMDKVNFMQSIKEIQERVAKLPIVDSRSLETMIYDENGLPK